MSRTIAIDYHQGEREARKSVLRFASDRGGFTELTAWLDVGKREHIAAIRENAREELACRPLASTPGSSPHPSDAR